MNKEVLREIITFLNYLQDKIEECYKKETEIMKERFLERIGKIK